MKDEKNLGADAAAVESAGSIDTDAAPHVVPQAEKNLERARDLMWQARRGDERMFATAMRLLEESARLCGSIEAADRMKARLLEGR